MAQSGRLTLSWVGKDKALLGTVDGCYQWVDRDDPRVTEVRLLRETAVVGNVSPSAAEDNLLITGDSRDALQSLTRIPEYAKHYLGKVKLVYIDPPFNTMQAFAQYEDALEHSVWLTMMRDRLLLIRDLLAPDGSVWIHLDDTEMAYCRVLMDEIFGRGNFRNAVIWRRTTSKSSAVRNLGTMHETILFYSASEQMAPNRVLLSYSDEYIEKKYTYSDERGRYRTSDLTAPGIRRGSSGEPWRGFSPTQKRRHWVAPDVGGVFDSLPTNATTQQKLDALLETGYIYFPAQEGRWPAFKRYLSSDGGVAVGDVWDDLPVLNSQERERNSFSTQKPERLLQRIIEVASAPGDIVVDCFAGSGTTAAAAHKMGRRWVAVERESTTVEDFIRPRLENIVNGEDPGGISEEVGWEKGGGFRALEVVRSMYDVEDRRAYLAEWITDDAFAEAVCAQLGFTVGDCPPFAGRKGRTRLAVIDGVADTSIIRAVVSRLDEGERVVVVAKAIATEAVQLLKELSPGSRLRKAPRDLLNRGVLR